MERGIVRPLLRGAPRINDFLIFLGLLTIWHLAFASFGLYHSHRLAPQRIEVISIIKATSLGRPSSLWPPWCSGSACGAGVLGGVLALDRAISRPDSAARDDRGQSYLVVEMARRNEEMGREARREFDAKYAAESNYSILTDVYRQAMARKSGARTAVLN